MAGTPMPIFHYIGNWLLEINIYKINNKKLQINLEGYATL